MKWPKTGFEMYHGNGDMSEKGKHPYLITRQRFRKISDYASYVAHNLGYTRLDESHRSKEFIETGISVLKQMIEALESHHKRVLEIQVIQDVNVECIDVSGGGYKTTVRAEKFYVGPKTMEASE